MLRPRSPSPNWRDGKEGDEPAAERAAGCAEQQMQQQAMQRTRRNPQGPARRKTPPGALWVTSWASPDAHHKKNRGQVDGGVPKKTTNAATTDRTANSPRRPRRCPTQPARPWD